MENKSDTSLQQPVTHYELLAEQIRSTNIRIDGIDKRIGLLTGIFSAVMGIGFTSILAILGIILTNLLAK